jgi:hypothetical protein
LSLLKERTRERNERDIYRWHLLKGIDDFHALDVSDFGRERSGREGGGGESHNSEKPVADHLKESQRERERERETRLDALFVCRKQRRTEKGMSLLSW